MKTLATALVLVGTLFIPVQDVIAQSADMPVPGLVVKDADGKVMGQVAGFDQGPSATDFFPVVVLNVEGKLAYLVHRPYGLINKSASDASGTGGATVYFTASDCMGDVYLDGIGETGIEALSGNAYGVGGPDPITGEYKLYRSTTLITALESLSSKWQGGSCVNYGPVTAGVIAAEEVTPNPLAGFHGPTTLNPERILTIDGGDRLP